MIHYYAQKGMRPSAVYHAPEGEKAFLYWSMVTEMEWKEKLAETMSKGGGCPAWPLFL